jgi:hypothetical protein
VGCAEAFWDAFCIEEDAVCQLTEDAAGEHEVIGYGRNGLES